jgi:uncharacterized repeat protein (TIGR01451 family)
MDRLVFGNVPNDTLSGGEMQSMAPGERRVLSFVYHAESEGTVDFVLDPPRPPEGWTQTLLIDPECAGQWTPKASPISGQELFVTPGDQICLLASMDSPVTGGVGSAVQFDVKATRFWFAPTLGLFQGQAELRSRGIVMLAERGLVLQKEWRTVETCPLDGPSSLRDPAPFQMFGTVVPGGRVEFRVQYRNPGSVPVTGIKLSDTVPDETVFESAFCGAMPTDGIQNCQVTVHPAAAGTGPIAWELVDDAGSHGGLRSADYGSVGYCLRLRLAGDMAP